MHEFLSLRKDHHVQNQFLGFLIAGGLAAVTILAVAALFLAPIS